MQADWIRAEVDLNMKHPASMNLLTDLHDKIKTIMHYLPIGV